MVTSTVLLEGTTKERATMSAEGYEVEGFAVREKGSARTEWFESLRAAKVYASADPDRMLYSATVTLNERVTEVTGQETFLERTSEGHRDYLRLVQGGKR